MGCTESVPVPPTLQPQLVGVWINTEKAAQMDPDLGGTSSPVRVKSFQASDGKYTYRRGTSPWTKKRPAATDHKNVWVRLSIHLDGRVRYEQLDHQGNYYVLDFPVNTPWEDSAATVEETTSTNIYNSTRRDEEVRIGDSPGNVEDTTLTSFSNSSRREVGVGTADALGARALGGTSQDKSESGSMEYRNCFGETKARINFEYFPRMQTGMYAYTDKERNVTLSQRSILSSGSKRSRQRSRLRITPCGTGKSHTLVRKRRSRTHQNSSIHGEEQV